MTETDIAVIEVRYADDHEWTVLAYVGPDRTGGKLGHKYEQLPHIQEIRIRYLNRGVTD